MTQRCDLAHVVYDALREHRRMYDAFHADATLYEPGNDDTYVDIDYRGKSYRIEINGPFEE